MYFIKYSFLLVFCAFDMFTGLAFYGKGTVSNTGNNTDNNPIRAQGEMKIKIGNSMFTATLYDNASANAFKSLLPMTIKMVELNGNEKYHGLSKSLPANSSNPGTIQNGDIMLFGSKTLVCFTRHSRLLTGIRGLAMWTMLPVWQQHLELET